MDAAMIAVAAPVGQRSQPTRVLPIAMSSIQTSTMGGGAVN